MMGFFDVRPLWLAVDQNESGFLTLDEWDEENYPHLIELFQLCCSQYSTVEFAFKHGMDRKGTGTVTFKELAAFCENFNYRGDARKAFKALDMVVSVALEDSFLTVNEAEFLKACVGERFVKDSKEMTPRLTMTLKTPRLGAAAASTSSRFSDKSPRQNLQRTPRQLPPLPQKLSMNYTSNYATLATQFCSNSSTPDGAG